jgi:hypothetical protein
MFTKVALFATMVPHNDRFLHQTVAKQRSSGRHRSFSEV